MSQNMTEGLNIAVGSSFDDAGLKRATVAISKFTSL